ncbi:MAG: hypothetical protein PHR61_05100 [Candidatus Absconditabacteria bacterium]|nr:hypothetical protein [Candidatus Absconditabacteria bacterium]
MTKGQNFKGKKPTNTPKGPSTQAQVDLRIAEVGKLLMQGYQRFEIVSIIQEKYSISSQQIDRYIKKVTERIREYNSENLDDDIALTESMISDIYRCAREEKKRGSALRALKLKMELKGLQVPRRMDTPGGLCIREEDLIEYGDDLLNSEEKKMVQDITGLKDLY